MKLFFTALGRLFVIAFGVLVAIVSASLFIGFGLASGMFPELMAEGVSVFNDKDADYAILTIITFGAGIAAIIEIAGLTLLPATIAIAVTEMMRWQSLSVQMVLGGLCALFIMFSVLPLPAGVMPSNGTVIVSLAAGFVATFFYWLIAGRNAGNWLGRSKVPEEPEY